MRQSQLFGKTLREPPKGEVSANAKLLERGGFTHKTMAGVYDFLPLGFRVMEKIKGIIREEINAIGGQEMLMTVLQPSERWEMTGRWQDDIITDWFKTMPTDMVPTLGLAPTHEESITEIAKRSIYSYRDLPLYIYQIQTKFRRELRAKSGLIRGREFLMNDLYSFHADEKDLHIFYTKTVVKAYEKIFKRCGLNVYMTEASGGIFTKEFTHEYQVLSDAGEDWVLYCESCGFAQNKEIATIQKGEKCPKCAKEIKASRGIEVGNIFKLGTKYSEPFNLFYSDHDGNKKPVVMGSYGIGVPRLAGAIVEIHNDEKGIIWPGEVSPFQAHLMELKSNDKKVKMEAEKIYHDLLAKGVEVLYDDREEKNPGEKFADADLIGIPWRIVVSEKTLAKKGVELKKRSEKDAKIIKTGEIIKRIK